MLSHSLYCWLCWLLLLLATAATAAAVLDELPGAAVSVHFALTKAIVTAQYEYTRRRWETTATVSCSGLKRQSLRTYRSRALVVDKTIQLLIVDRTTLLFHSRTNTWFLVSS